MVDEIITTHIKILLKSSSPKIYADRKTHAVAIKMFLILNKLRMCRIVFMKYILVQNIEGLYLNQISNLLYNYFS